ncbi:hypothetical protein FIBSPDRAFT_855235 [Athelia psychrophila]|uniref:Uncharacterized protein n=1 Tax=Athelia psychrophila TaxID=1759441 RepID=A0A166PCG0_9AGAM|nr:hypothetical protein FIBSPDRAFT_855235 [Fibularhizoctonia sp. CBS 109695]
MSLAHTTRTHIAPTLTRAHSTSPYGRSHILKRRAPTLPAPLVPHFPQRVIRADGSTFVQHTTSPRSLFKLTRDLTNNPLWNAAKMSGARMDEELVGGAVGRFKRRFEGSVGMGEVDWTDMGEGGVEGVEGQVVKGEDKSMKGPKAPTNGRKK